jgi:hypothetical protein
LDGGCLTQPSKKRHAGQGQGEKLSQQGSYAGLVLFGSSASGFLFGGLLAFPAPIIEVTAQPDEESEKQQTSANG